LARADGWLIILKKFKYLHARPSRTYNDVIKVDVKVGSVVASDLEIDLEPATFAARFGSVGLGGIVSDANVRN
jgi:hypothetical protein